MPTSYLDVIRASFTTNIFWKSNKVKEINKDIHGRQFEMSFEIIPPVDGDIVICRFDPDLIKIFPYFSQVKDIQKICDFFIFAQSGQKKFLFLVEMKKSSGSPQEQLIISESFAQFLLKRIAIAHNQQLDDVQIRFIGLKESYKQQKAAFSAFKNLEYKDRYVLLPCNNRIHLSKLINAPSN